MAEIEGEYEYDMDLPGDWEEVGLETIKDFVVKEILVDVEKKDIEWRVSEGKLKFKMRGGKRCL